MLLKNKFYVLPIDKSSKMNFDALSKGVLLDRNGDLGVNYFVSGLKCSDKELSPYKIINDPKYTKNGTLRDRLLTDVHNFPIFIVSEKVKDFIQNYTSMLAEFYNVEFDSINGKPLASYFICNLINKIDCANYDESEIDFNFYTESNVGYGGIYTIDSLVIDISKIPDNLHMFLLGNIDYPVILVSQFLKDEIEKHKLSGFYFVQPEKFML